MNTIHLNRVNLESNNYVLKAGSHSDYWFGISENKVLNYCEKFNDDFNIIIYGSEGEEGDYYLIPFANIKDLLRPESLYSFNARMRWVGDIKSHVLRLRRSKIERNISQYYSLPIDKNGSSLLTSKEALNDFSIENAKREISVRLKQSQFRAQVLKNFGHSCCLSYVQEPSLLVASHIIPWAEKISSRLDPSNGLCFSVLYDKLFDKGYFTVKSDNRIGITKYLDRISSPTRNYLTVIDGLKIKEHIQLFYG